MGGSAETRVDVCLAATPAEQLDWLEEAFALGLAAGILPRLADMARAYTPAEIDVIEIERWGRRRDEHGRYRPA